jgi:hypothetical protein
VCCKGKSQATSIETEVRLASPGREPADVPFGYTLLRAGDTLVVTRIDRLARSLKDLQDIVYELKDRGVALKATEQPVDTSTAAGKAFLECWAYSPNLKRI